jgi:hypothetical protein
MGETPSDKITNPKIAKTVARLAQRKAMPDAKWEPNSFSKLLQAITTAPQDRPETPGPTPQIITQEDIDREVQKLRRSREDEFALGAD